jgi:hypothetical protein
MDDHIELWYSLDIKIKTINYNKDIFKQLKISYLELIITFFS